MSNTIWRKHKTTENRARIIFKPMMQFLWCWRPWKYTSYETDNSDVNPKEEWLWCSLILFRQGLQYHQLLKLLLTFSKWSWCLPNTCIVLHNLRCGVYVFSWLPFNLMGKYMGVVKKMTFNLAIYFWYIENVLEHAS